MSQRKQTRAQLQIFHAYSGREQYLELYSKDEWIYANGTTTIDHHSKKKYGQLANI